MRALIATLALATTLGAVETSAISRKELAEYYGSVKNLKKEELKTALYDIVKSHKAISYGSGATNSTWWAFYVTDKTDDGQVLNRYSDETFYFGNRGESVSGMNIEHSFPKSWWGGDKNNAYKDLFNLYPSPSDDNGQKSNYPMGYVTDVKYDSGEGYDKVGTGMVNGKSQSCWEPGDGWKGDFARAYMYMAVCYQDLTWVNMGLQTLQCDTWPTLRQWAQELYTEWSATDKVDNIEVSRNEAVYGIQENRNPFVDFPFLCEYIWGDSVDVAFNPVNAVSTATDDTRYGCYEPATPSTPEPSPYIYYADCTSNYGGMTATIISPSDGSLSNVWTKSSTYGWKASAYISGTKQASEATVTTPEIDLSEYKDITLTFEHAVKFAASPSSVLSVEVECEGKVTTLSVPTWPAGDSWTFYDSGEVSLDDYAGKTIKLIFRYTSSTSEASTWEVREIKVHGEKVTSSLSDVEIAPSAPDFNLPYEVYSLDGKRIADTHIIRGIVIVRQNGHSWLISRQ